MKPESVRALWISALVLAVAGSMIPSPSGTFLISIVAALMALPAVVLGRRGARVGGAMACILSVVLAVATFPGMQKDQSGYIDRSKARTQDSGASVPRPPGEVTPRGAEAR